MNVLARIFHFPLLGKELRERAARRQTYVLRVIYALLFFGAFLWMTRGWLGEFRMDRLGTGRDLLDPFIILQFLGIHLFTPALMCGLIAGEHERGSLPLLLLTPMSPGRIVIQKYCAGLIPMFTMLLLGAPLLGIGYAFGGLSPADVVALALVLLLAVLEVGAFALLCSVLCRSTVRAFILTYIAGAALLAVVTFIAHELGQLWAKPPWLLQPNNFALFIPAGIHANLEGELFSWPWVRSFALWSAPSLALTLGSLALARSQLATHVVFQDRRSRTNRVSWLRRVFRRRAGERSSADFSKGDLGTLPGNEPVTWRESRRFGLIGRGFWYWSVALIGLVLAAIAMLLSGPDVAARDHAGWLQLLQIGLAELGALAMIGYATSATNAERAGETLAMLLTTPLSAREILTQKARLLWRMQAVLLPAILMLFVVEAFFSFFAGGSRRTDDSLITMLLAAAAGLVIYPSVIGWGALWLGLICRTSRAALLLALGTAGSVVLLPLWLIESISSVILTEGTDTWNALVHILSPTHFQVTRSRQQLYFQTGDFWWITIVAHYALYGTLALTLRWLCLARADRYLREPAR